MTDLLYPMAPCRNCGCQPTAPLGEFCPASDPDDLDFHDFGRCEGGAVTLPAAPPSERLPSSVHNSRREPSGAEGGRSSSSGR